MAFLLGGANSATGSYEISNSLRFNDDDDANLTLNPGTSSDNKTCTLSWWLKLGIPLTNGTDYHFSNHTDANNRLRVAISNTGEFKLFGKLSGSTFVDIYTNAQYKDPSAWYHFMVILDSTDGTAADRTQLWINGLRNTDVTLGTSPASNDDMIWGSRDNMTIGAGHSGSAANANPYDGYFAEMHFIDGQKKASTDFGEFDDNGVWIPKEYSGTYGTNGFFMEFKETGTGTASASTIGADTSGNTNHFTSTNLAATDITTDTPTNNFCTLNPLNDVAITYSEGNLHATNDGAAGTATGTMAPSNGKWYFEIELSGAANFAAGVVNLDAWPSMTNIYPYAYSAMVLIESNANYNVTYGNTASSPTTLQNSADLVTAKYGFAIDIDENDLYVSADGNWYTGSAFDNTSFGSATAVTTDLPSGVPLTFVMRNPDGVIARCNFGNPGGDDSIASGNADANGYGNFEYAVPSGYYALCTKNLAEYG